MWQKICWVLAAVFFSFCSNQNVANIRSASERVTGTSTNPDKPSLLHVRPHTSRHSCTGSCVHVTLRNSRITLKVLRSTWTHRYVWKWLTAHGSVCCSCFFIAFKELKPEWTGSCWLQTWSRSKSCSRSAVGVCQSWRSTLGRGRKTPAAGSVETDLSCKKSSRGRNPWVKGQTHKFISTQSQ